MTFARKFTYPLLEGLNAWWGCFLKKLPSGGGYVYTDDSMSDPDNEHENQRVPNPQIGLALIRRSLSAQIDIGKAIGETPDPLVVDMLAHLVPFNVGIAAANPPAPAPGPPTSHFDCSNCSDASRQFLLLPGQACSPDYHDDAMHSCSAIHKSAECCAAMCAGDPDCQAFTFCKGPSKNCPHTSCWKYRDRGGSHGSGRNFTCSTRAGNFTSGRRKEHPKRTHIYGQDQQQGQGQPMWVAFENATVRQSDGFALYPLWPSEMVNGISAMASDRNIAAASVKFCE
eukprot:SAG31_NODE_1340_length_8709_cov_8.259117_4_plen_284_part_00